MDYLKKDKDKRFGSNKGQKNEDEAEQLITAETAKSQLTLA